MEIAPTLCRRTENVISRNNCPLDDSRASEICQVVYLQKPWIGKAKHIVSNNCTQSQQYRPTEDSIIENNEVNFDKISESQPTTEQLIDPGRLADIESQIEIEVPEERPKKVPNQNFKLASYAANFMGPKYTIPEVSSTQSNDEDNIHISFTPAQEVTENLSPGNVAEQISVNNDQHTDNYYRVDETNQEASEDLHRAKRSTKNNNIDSSSSSSSSSSSEEEPVKIKKNKKVADSSSSSSSSSSSEDDSKVTKKYDKDSDSSSSSSSSSSSIDNKKHKPQGEFYKSLLE